MSTLPTAERPTVEEVLGLLRGVIDPELACDIVELGMVKDVEVVDSTVQVTIALTTAGCPLRAQIQRDVRARIESLPGVSSVTIDWTVLSGSEKAATMDRARRNAAENPPATRVPANTRVIMVASGKGGVGKSTVTANVAAGLAARGFTVGVLDADIWGFSIPRMLGVEGRLEGDVASGRITPRRRAVGSGTLEVVSMGFLVDDEETALMWRGLMLNRAVQHFLEDVAWGPLDYLVIDMPPGTGDVQMGLARMLPRSEMLIVTTPARAAQKVAARVATMGRRSHLRIAGVIENMAGFVTPDGAEYAVFGRGGGPELAASVGVQLLASIPLDGAVVDGGDDGAPSVLEGTGPGADAFRGLVDLLVTEVFPPVDLGGCSARLLAAADAALAAAEQA